MKARHHHPHCTKCSGALYVGCPSRLSAPSLDFYQGSGADFSQEVGMWMWMMVLSVVSGLIIGVALVVIAQMLSKL